LALRPLEPALAVLPVRVRQPFANRREAGQELAHAVQALRLPQPLVLALPRGGVPVAAEVARVLGAPLELLLVRKIGAPGQPELAVGAMAWRGSEHGPQPQTVLDAGLVTATGADPAYVRRVLAREGVELARRQRRYLGGRELLSLAGRSVIVVADGIATGSTVRAALQALRDSEAPGQAPRAIVLAVPVAPSEVLEALADAVETIVCLWTPVPFSAVGVHYRAFAQVSDEDVLAALRTSSAATSPPSGVQPR